MGTADRTRLNDELTWELVRDEWELLLAVGSGPTTLATVASTLDAGEGDVSARLGLLCVHGMVVKGADGYALTRVYHQRREGMASYLRDLVLKRLDVGGAVPLSSGLREGLGQGEQVRAWIARADESLLPQIVDLASQPEGPASERFWLVFAVASGTAAYCGPDTEASIAGILRVLRAAALERADAPNADTAKLWVAEMRTDRDVADTISERFDTFFGRATPAVPGGGAMCYAVLPVMSEEPCSDA